jgi:hypothetical protein
MDNPQRSKWQVARALLIGFGLFVLIKLVEALIRGEWRHDHGWSDVALGVMFLAFIFSFGIFVLWGRENHWLGVFRRPLNALIVGAAFGVVKWVGVPLADGVFWGFVVAGLILGWFAEKWVGNI